MDLEICYKKMRISKVILGMLIALFLISCSTQLYNTGKTTSGQTADILKQEHSEIKRITSPDGLADAVIVRVKTDSLSADGFIICLIAAGTKLEDLTNSSEPNFFYANRIEDLELAWKDSKLLEIRYKRAAILTYRNYHWMLKDNGNTSDYCIELRLVPQSEHSLPPGY